MNEIKVPISPGELLDKITILRIKSERMSDPAKLSNVRLELRALEETWSASAYAKIDIEADVSALGDEGARWDAERAVGFTSESIIRSAADAAAAASGAHVVTLKAA